MENARACIKMRFHNDWRHDFDVHKIMERIQAVCILLITVQNSSKGHQLHINIFLDALYLQVFTDYGRE